MIKKKFYFSGFLINQTNSYSKFERGGEGEHIPQALTICSRWKKPWKKRCCRRKFSKICRESKKEKQTQLVTYLSGFIAPKIWIKTEKVEGCFKLSTMTNHRQAAVAGWQPHKRLLFQIDFHTLPLNFLWLYNFY